VLGGFTVAVGGDVIQWTGRRASRNLFQLLIQRHPQPINREVLMEAIWPGAAPASSRNRFNVAVHDLRKQFRAEGLGDEIVQHEGEVYRLNPKVDLRIDAAEFVRGVDALLNGRRDLERQSLDELTAVVRLYRGEYLGTEPHEEWAIARRRYLRRLYISAQDVIARARLTEGDFEACIDACRMITEIDEAHEVAHRRMMMALARAGRTSQALHQFEVCKAGLAAQIGVEPSEQTLQLARDIRGGTYA
jgi:DNA-binding SARP family transcriptional activator